MRLKISLRSVLIFIATALIIVGILNINNQPKKSYQSLKFSDFVSNIKAGKIEEVLISGQNVLSIDKSKRKKITQFPSQDSSFIQRLLDNDVKITVVNPEEKQMPLLWAIIMNWFPQFAFIAVFVWLNLGRFNFANSKAKRTTKREKRVTFQNVAGLDEAKEELGEVVDFLRNPEKFASIGAKIPKGVLLYGPPGTGKTLLARAIAGEANVEFMIASGSEFVEMFVGVGASRVRDLFAQARKYEKCVIFIDELDSVGGKRSNSGFQNDERNTTLNQLLTEMDGFLPNKQIIVIGATNIVDVLDPALLRPGRFDKIIQIPLPDAKGRKEILAVNLDTVATNPDGLNLKNVVNATVGTSGAELTKVVNEAAILATKRGSAYVTEEILEEALEMTIFGRKKSMNVHKKEIEITAYHESGHAIVKLSMSNSDPIYKFSIEPTQMYFGVVISLPEREGLDAFKSKEEFLDLICVLLGGRAAESIKFGKITAGATSDLQKANQIARRMVSEFGMSDELRNFNFDFSDYRRPSESTYAKIDEIISQIIEEQWKRALDIIKEREVDFELLAKSVLKYETLTGKEIEYLLQNRSLDGYQKLINYDDLYLYKKRNQNPINSFAQLEENDQDDYEE